MSTSRNPAKRLFATELNDATHQYKEDPDDDRSPRMTLLPTGVEANRILLTGTLTEVDNVGSSSDYFRGRILDGSGGEDALPAFVYAGQYQPECMTFLRQADAPEYVTIVGQPKVYEPEPDEDEDEGQPDKYVSIRPQAMQAVDKETRNNWLIEAANHTLTRVQRFATARQDGSLDRNMEEAIAEYGSDLEKYRDGAETALQTLTED